MVRTKELNNKASKRKYKILIIKVPQCSYPLGKENEDLISVARFNPMPSLALGYLAGFLRKYGSDDFEITLKDVNVEAYLDATNGEVELTSLIHRVESEFKNAEYDIACISSAFVSNHRWVKLAVECARRYHPGKPVVIGGGYPTLYSEIAMLETKADYCIIGEGEDTFLKILNQIFSVENPRFEILFSDASGYAYWERGKLLIVPKKSFIKDLDLLPFPAWDLLNVREFLAKHPLRAIYCITSRGCPFKCIYCSTFLSWGSAIRNRSAQNVLDEIDWLYESFGVHHIHFVDDNMAVDKRRIDTILHGIIDSNYDDLTWAASAFSINTLNRETIDLMIKSNMTRVTLPVEVGSPKMQKRIKKNLDLNKVEEVYRCFEEYDIPIRLTIMLGFPMETIEDINTSVDFVKRLNPHEAHVNIVTPWPGTEMYDYALKNGHLDSEIELDELDHTKDVGFVNVPWSYQEIKKLRSDLNISVNFLRNRDLESPERHERLLEKWKSFETGLPDHAILYISVGYLCTLIGYRSESIRYYEKACSLFAKESVRNAYSEYLEWNDVPSIRDFKNRMEKCLDQVLL